jgi:hypothetical protein
MVFTSGQIQSHGGKAANPVKWAVSHWSTESCGLLMEVGCSLTYEILEDHFNSFYWGNHYPESSRQQVETGRLLLAHASHLLIDDLEAFFRRSTTLAARSPEALGILLSHVYPPLRERPQSERARYAMVASPENFCLLLGTQTIDPASILAVEQAVLANPSAWSCAFLPRWDTSMATSSIILHQPESLLGIFAASYSRDYAPNVTTAWEKVLAQIITSGDCNAKRGSLIIPLLQFDRIGDNLDNSARRLNQKLASWIELLRTAGADLSFLADNERRIFSRQLIEIRCYSHRYPSLSSVRVVGISTGPDSGDWKVHLANPLDEWAADLWNLVHEGPEQVVPGSWLDEELEAERELRSRNGQFKTLWTSRRKRKRHLRHMGIPASAAREILGEAWIHYPEVNKHFNGRAIMERDGTKSQFLAFNDGQQLRSNPEVDPFDYLILLCDSEGYHTGDMTVGDYYSSCYTNSPTPD